MIIIGIGSAGFKSLLVTCGVPWSEYRTSLLKKAVQMNILGMSSEVSKELAGHCAKGMYVLNNNRTST